MKNSRTFSFILIALIYVVAALFGVWAYVALAQMDVWLRLLIADVFATVITFVFSVLFKNASVYDPYWSVQPIVIVFAFAFYNSITLPKILLLIAIAFWGVRLTANWAVNFYGLNYQDWRYTMLKEKTGVFYPIINFTGIHMVPTLIVYACTLPAVYVILSDMPITPIAICCFALSVIAVVIQGSADYQMYKFRLNKTSMFINVGLWKYSRHPNYFAEILMWWSVALFAVSVLGFKWYLILGAILNNLLFLFVSIPLADGKQSKKEGFEDYKKSTRMLLPIKKF
ncbi:MAG: DUF1295 domain-containing protein [Clostridia bacterium]|nr:DUF1295 domain-containing protein [Clostridia bacterium]